MRYNGSCVGPAVVHAIWAWAEIGGARANGTAATRRGKRRSMIRRESDASDSASSSASYRSSGAFRSGSERSAARQRTYAAVTAQRKTSSAAKALASAYKACEDCGSKRRRASHHSSGKRVKLPIIQCVGWDVKVLVYTGSTQTLVHTDAARDSGWLGAVTPCNCDATTVPGVTAIGGTKLVLDLKPTSRVKRTIKAHVLDCGPQNYQVILGADALCSLGLG
ncbi:hypothetical protein AAG570_010815 [Ranatra chinensis]|uniref:Uncharacterized protein n=1 Tax=Ranatra chinensis TaxID=642074 RepID=A0ABD0YX76_9HEMI